MSSNDIWSTSDDDLGSDPLYHKILSNEELEVLRQKASAAESPSSGVALPQNPLFVARSPPPSPPLLPFLAHERATDPEDAITHVATTNEDNTMLEDDGYLATGSDYDADHSSSANSEDSGFKRGSGPGNPPFAEMRGTPGSYTTASTLVRDARSVFSFHSSVDLHLFKDSHGRTFNALNKAYHLPGDNEEHERLDIQHKIMTYCVGGLYPAQDIVDNLLRPNQGHTPVVLDVGTGMSMKPLTETRG
ncbi:hypothetical protein FRC02_004537 [Tulasnella sp. 418]|nr:hypothetical protein FRC02_004537 [Tulasnella sp. 418]